MIVALLSLVLGGQLITEHYGLAEVAARGHIVYEVEIVTPLDKQKMIELKIMRSFKRTIENRAPRNGRRDGTTVKVALYTGVEWDDPHKSPLEVRLAGSMPAKSLKKGDVAFAVQHEGSDAVFDMLAPDEVNRRKIAILFEPEGMKQLESATDDELFALLRDRDLALPAYELLSARKKLIPAKSILTAPKPVLEKFWATGDRAKFLEECAQLPREVELERTLYWFIGNHFATTPLPALAKLIARLDVERKEDRRIIEDLHHAIRTLPPEVDAAPLVPLVLSYEKTRETYARDDKLLLPFGERLDEKSRIALTVGLLEIAHTSKQAGKGLDLLLLETAAKLGERSPSPVLIDALAKIDPKRGHPNLTLKHMIAIGIAVSAKYPAETARVNALITPMIEHGIPSESKDVEAFRAAMKAAAPTLSAPITFELAEGETKYLPGGLRVGFIAGAIQIYQKGRGRTESFKEDETWFREGYEEPFRYDVARIGAERRLKVTISRPATPPEQKSDAEMYKIGRAFAAQAGCPDYEAHRQEAWHGLAFLDASGPNGKRCKLILGGYTGSLLELK